MEAKKEIIPLEFDLVVFYKLCDPPSPTEG